MQLIKRISDWWIDRALRIHELTGEELCEAVEELRKNSLARMDHLAYLLSRLAKTDPYVLEEELSNTNALLSENFKKLSRLLLEFENRFDENTGEENA